MPLKKSASGVTAHLLDALLEVEVIFGMWLHSGMLLREGPFTSRIDRAPIVALIIVSPQAIEAVSSLKFVLSGTVVQTAMIAVPQFVLGRTTGTELAVVRART